MDVLLKVKQLRAPSGHLSTSTLISSVLYLQPYPLCNFHSWAAQERSFPAAQVFLHHDGQVHTGSNHLYLLIDYG